MIKITIITVCYNAKKKLKETIDNVWEQVYGDIEHIIIDGASADGTADMLAEYSGNRNIRFYSEKDYGIYNAMNRGIARASGDYIIFLNAGDTFYTKDVLAEAASIIEKNKTAIYYGKIAVTSVGRERILDVEEDIKEGVAIGWMPCHQAIFAPVSSLRNHYFCEKYQIRADFEWLVYCMSNHMETIKLPFVVSNYDEDGVSSDAGYMMIRHGETQEILNNYLPSLLEGQNVLQYQENRIRGLMETSGKYQILFKFMGQWLSFMQMGYKMEDYFVKHHYYHVAVYGIGLIGQRFIDGVRDTQVTVEYAIDRDADKIHADVRVVPPDSNLEPVDVIVVTTITYIQEIRNSLNGRMDCKVISMKEVLDEMMRRKIQ